MKRRLRRDNPEPQTPENALRYTTYQYLFLTTVANGAKHLDTVAPGWARLIDLSTFNMRYAESNLIGQLLRNGASGLLHLTTAHEMQLMAHGFLPTTADEYSLDALTVAWLNQIVDRLNEVGK